MDGVAVGAMFTGLAALVTSLAGLRKTRDNSEDIGAIKRAHAECQQNLEKLRREFRAWKRSHK